MQKGPIQTERQSTLTRKRKQWSGAAILQKRKGSNLSPMGKMARSRIPTAMVMIRVRPRTKNTNQTSLKENSRPRLQPAILILSYTVAVLPPTEKVDDEGRYNHAINPP